MVRWFEGGVNQVKDKLEKFTKNCTKTLLQWNENTFLHRRHAFTPKDFQMHQQSLDHILQTRNLANKIEEF
jgi:hypothetical protein